MSGMSKESVECTPEEYKMIQIIKGLIGKLEALSIEELEELRPVWLEGIEKLEADPVGVAFANDLVDRVIRSKREGVEVI